MLSRLLHGDVRPMSHQLEDVLALERHPRVNLLNGLGTGKMFTGAWLVQRWWIRGMVDCVIVVAPSMCAQDWFDAFLHRAFPERMCEVHDSRPPNHEIIDDFMTCRVRQDPSRLHVLVASYGSMRSLVGRRTESRYVIDADSVFLSSLRGRRVAVIFDESQGVKRHHASR